MVCYAILELVRQMLILCAGVVYNVFESVDVIALIRGGDYDDLGLTVGEGLKKRSPVCL